MQIPQLKSVLLQKSILLHFSYVVSWANEARRKYGLKSTTGRGERAIILFELYLL